MRTRIFILIILFILLFTPGHALAQDYSYRIPEMSVDVYWNEDGTVSLEYNFLFQNNPNGHPIEYVDLGMPRDDFDASSIRADVNGQPVSDISRSGYEGTGSGVAIGLGRYTIPPGESGRVHVFVGRVENMYELDPGEDEYASGVFAPATFLRPYSTGTTDMTVTFHLPPAVQPEEPRWHAAPGAFSSEPETGFDDQGRIIYIWRNPQADPSVSYPFGFSIPLQYVPDSAIRRANPLAFLSNIDLSCLMPLGCVGFFALVIGLSIYGESKRKLQYLPPKIAIEGHGIKRGLTAVEAAILMEQPMDKILTMILFSTIKKNAAEVITREPLEIKVLEPLPESLRYYEKDFLKAFQLPKGAQRNKALQEMVVSLIKGVSSAMKGFSRRETVEYYRDIMQRAWAQVEAADTPEVKSQKYDEVMEWTMLDRDYDRRTRDVFRTGPVFLPGWWGRYDPGFGRAPATRTGAPSAPTSQPAGGQISMPNLPGSAFAASVVGGVQNFASGVVGNITDFTSRITNQTNPPPKPSASSRSSRGGGGGGRSCACACACAGCACACAGGGR